MSEIIFATATTLANAIRQKYLSAVEVLDAHLSHIATYNPQVNALVTVDEAGARRRAQAADAALAHGESWGPLHGVPVTLKDLRAVAGMRSTYGGLPEYAEHVPSQDSTVATKLRQAGAIILGMSNVHFSDRNIFGRTNNPWNLERSPHMTSAGSAAAVAAGLSPLDIGTDTSGSILNPAAFCGVFGMRPTEHRVSNAGSGMPPHTLTWMPFTVQGPLARSVDDLELALRVMSGPDGRDTLVPPLPWSSRPSIRLQDTRLAWVHTLPQMPLAQDIRAAIERLVADLEHVCGRVEQTVPDIDFPSEHEVAWRLTRIHWREELQSQGWLSADAPAVTTEDYFAALRLREAFVGAWEAFFTHWDVFLCPMWMHTANLHTETLLVIDGITYSWEDAVPSTETISPITGLPSVVIPIAHDRQGLPIGVQLIGRRWHDEELLAIAAQLVEHTGGFQRPPGY